MTIPAFLPLVAKGQMQAWLLLPTPSCTRHLQGLGSQEAAPVLADSTGGLMSHSKMRGGGGSKQDPAARAPRTSPSRGLTPTV